MNDAERALAELNDATEAGKVQLVEGAEMVGACIAYEETSLPAVVLMMDVSTPADGSTARLYLAFDLRDAKAIGEGLATVAAGLAVNAGTSN